MNDLLGKGNKTFTEVQQPQIVEMTHCNYINGVAGTKQNQ